MTLQQRELAEQEAQKSAEEQISAGRDAREKGEEQMRKVLDEMTGLSDDAK